jgi:hypothetical protein
VHSQPETLSESPQTCWEYKVVSATFGTKLEVELNAWGSDGWEVVSIAGMSGTVTVTGNKIFVVLKRRSLAHEAAATAASEYLTTLRNHYGPPAFDHVATCHGDGLMLRAARVLIDSGQRPNNPLGVLDAACTLMANRKPSSNDAQLLQIAYLDVEPHGRR